MTSKITSDRMPESGIRSDTPPLSPVSSLQEAVADTLQRVLLGWNSGHDMGSSG